MKFIVVIFSLCYFVCVYGEDLFWKPTFLTEHISKISRLGDNVKNEAEILTSKVTNYMNVARNTGQKITQGVETFFDNTKNQFNEMFINRFKGNSKANVDKEKVNISNNSPLNDGRPSIEMSLDAPQIIGMHGYDVEMHTVLTDDGYLLSLHRIPHGKNDSAGTYGNQAVIIQHGLFSSSVDFISNGPKKGLGFIMADAGYDVWLGNFRGGLYSRAHIKYTTDQAAFWDFSWHDIALHDLPAIIDYVNAIKKSDRKTLYVGHSMGNTALFVLLSMRPEYNKKLKAAFSLAPVAYMSTLKTPIRYLTPFVDSLEWIRKYLGVREFKPQHTALQYLGSGCSSDFYKDLMCSNLIFLAAGFDAEQLDKENLLNILTHNTASSSTKTVIHYAQVIRDKGRFQQFDYGSNGNMIRYGTKIPPQYPIDKITLPIALFASHNDWLVGMPDSIKLYKDLPNPIDIYEVPFENFNHIDFLWAVDAKTLLYDHLLHLMSKFKTKNDQQSIWERLIKEMKFGKELYHK